MNKKSVYIETTIISYLTSRPNRDIRAAAWQQLTTQWWEYERDKYELFSSELVKAEAMGGEKEAAERRLVCLNTIPEVSVSDEAKELAARLVKEGGVPASAELDALHIALACVYNIDYLLTWNCRHIDNAATKPLIREICSTAGYRCSEICTPLELLTEDLDDV